MRKKEERKRGKARKKERKKRNKLNSGGLGLGPYIILGGLGPRGAQQGPR